MDEEKPNLEEPVIPVEKTDEGCIYRGHKKMQGCLESVFRGYANCVVKLPWVFIIIGLLIAVACSFGFFFGNYDDEPRRVWIPRDSPASRNWDDVEDKFGDPVTRYTVYIVSEDDDNPDLLNPQAM